MMKCLGKLFAKFKLNVVDLSEYANQFLSCFCFKYFMRDPWLRRTKILTILETAKP